MPVTMTRHPTVTISRDACARWWASFAALAPGAQQHFAQQQEGTEETHKHGIDEDTIVGLDAGIKNLLTDHTGHRVAGPKERRIVERRARTKRNAKKGHARACARGHIPDHGTRRKTLRADKQQALAHLYTPGSPIAQQRAATKAERVARAKRSREYARIAQQDKEREGQKAQAQPTTAGAEHAGPDPTRKSRKTKHKGKGSGAQRRRPTHRRDHADRKGRRLDRRMSRRTSGSKRHEQARIARAKHCAWTADHRREHLHQTSSTMVRSWKALVIETLNLRGLARAMLGKSVLDAGLGTLLAQLQYKAQWNAIPITKCPTHYPSSQRCSHCGHQYRELTLSMREWTCPACTTRHDRDTNAGRNIKAYGVSWWTAQGHTILTSRTHRLGGTASGSRPRERPGSAHNVAATSLARRGTAIRTSNREQVTDELSGTVKP